MQLNNENYVIYTKAKEDLAMVIAQMVSGIDGVTPEQDDYELACEVEQMIEDKINEYYF